MLCCCRRPELRTRIRTWLLDYDKIQSFAVILIYIQISCALIGSLGALYNGVLLIDLAIALFALVAIESSSQSLGRTYAVLLFCCILLDISWFILFAHEIWHISSDTYGTFVIFSVKLTLCMEIIGFFVRLSSSFLWIQMYILGVSYLEATVPREADDDLRNSFINPATPSVDRHPSGFDDVLGGSIYDPVNYSSLFEDGKDDAYMNSGGQAHSIAIQSTSTAETSEVKPFFGKTVESKSILWGRSKYEGHESSPTKKGTRGREQDETFQGGENDKWTALYVRSEKGNTI